MYFHDCTMKTLHVYSRFDMCAFGSCKKGGTNVSFTFFGLFSRFILQAFVTRLKLLKFDFDFSVYNKTKTLIEIFTSFDTSYLRRITSSASTSLSLSSAIKQEHVVRKEAEIKRHL